MRKVSRANLETRFSEVLTICIRVVIRLGYGLGLATRIRVAILFLVK